MTGVEIKALLCSCVLVFLLALCYGYYAYGRPHMVERFRAPSVLLIDDRMHATIVLEGNTYDDGVVRGLVPISEGKVSLATSAAAFGTRDDDATPAHTANTNATLRCVNISKYKPRGNCIVACTNDVVYPIFVGTSFFDDERDLVYLAGKRVGYIDETDVPILHRVLECNNMSVADVALVAVRLSDLWQGSVSYAQTCDCVFVMMNPLDPAMDGFRSMKVALYSYRHMDVDRAKKQMPHAVLTQIDVTRLFLRMLAPRRVDTLLAFRNIIYATTTTFDNYTLDLVIGYFGENMGHLNFFERYYQLHPRTAEFQKAFNDDLNVDRSAFPILEQFLPQTQTRTLTQTQIQAQIQAHTPTLQTQSPTMLVNYVPAVPVHQDPRLQVAPRRNVSGFLVPERNTFYADKDVIETVPLIVGDLVVLAYQRRPEENGEYTVVSIQDGGATLERRNPRYPVTVDTSDETHFCVTDPSIVYKHECLSIRDRFGNLKKKVDVWDGPCKSDLQCPFYHFDPYTKSYKGGCQNGYCDMPLGYTRIGFTKYVNQ